MVFSGENLLPHMLCEIALTSNIIMSDKKMSDTTFITVSFITLLPECGLSECVSGLIGFTKTMKNVIKFKFPSIDNDSEDSRDGALIQCIVG